MSKDNEQPTKEELLTASRVYWKEKEKYVNGKRVLETMVYSFSFENHMNELKRERGGHRKRFWRR